MYSAIEEDNADELQKGLKASIPFKNQIPAPQENSEIVKKLTSERDELLKVLNQKNLQMFEAIKLMRLLKSELESEPDLMIKLDHNQKFLDSILY